MTAGGVVAAAKEGNGLAGAMAFAHLGDQGLRPGVGRKLGAVALREAGPVRFLSLRPTRMRMRFPVVFEQRCRRGEVALPAIEALAPHPTRPVPHDKPAFPVIGVLRQLAGMFVTFQQGNNRDLWWSFPNYS